MDKRFLSAFTDPAKIKMLGRFVSPFSMLHRMQLEAVESPFVIDGKQVRHADLLIAVKICAGEPVDKLSLKDHFFLGRLKASDEYFIEQLNRFTEYVLLRAWPKFWERKSKQHDSSGIPWVLTVVAGLVRNGISEHRAWTMPESQAIWLHSAISVSHGSDLKILTTEEEQLIEKLEQE